MTSLAERSVSPFAKILYVGDSGAGKTGSLASLVPDYELRFIDYDNGLDPLLYILPQEQLARVQYNTFRDIYHISKALKKPVLKGQPTALMDSFKAIDKWPDDGSDPSKWGPDKILVLDSIALAGRSAHAWADKHSNNRDGRAIVGLAQELIRNMIATITADSFQTNVIMISHIDYPDPEYDEGKLKVDLKGIVSSIGKALGREIPKYFNTMILAEAKGSGESVKRKIRTMPTRLVTLKNPRWQELGDELDLETGMAEIFAALRST